jgi:8-oxo-dGTP pyrophosphatase MutT (NUDIX family)
MDIASIKSKINGTTPYISGWDKMKRAAVIIPVVEISGKLNLLFEVRSKKLISQPGDICFPGGKIEDGETPKEAALREVEEELGLRDINVINELDIIILNNSIIIHSFLAVINNIGELNLSGCEVDHVFYVPLDEIINDNPLEVSNKVILQRGEDFPYDLIESGKNYKFKEGKSRTLFYKYKEYVIWGITGEMLKNLLDKLKTLE